MFVDEATHFVDIAVDDDVETLVDSVVLANVFGGELFRHCGGVAVSGCTELLPERGDTGLVLET